jgi:membrane protease YdiL (CAAX protease family)
MGQPSRPLMQTGSDLLWWLVAFVCGVGAENFVIGYVFGISPYLASFGGEPKIWVARFFQPLVTLSILTLVLRRRGEDWYSIGLRKPANWKRFTLQVTCGILALFGVRYIVHYWVVVPLHLRYFGVEIHDVPTLAAALAYSIFGAGLEEELVFRGFIPSRLAKGFGNGQTGWQLGIAISAVVFGLLHFALGPADMAFATVGGILLGEVYLWSERNLWVVVAIHSLYAVTVRLVDFAHR